jgi:metal-responsive CopG/Arc/MetJ family transcriptional regulator
MNATLDRIKEETHRSKSEIIKQAIASYIEKQEEKKLERAVELMYDEYANDSELTSLTLLDGEDFQ